MPLLERSSTGRSKILPLTLPSNLITAFSLGRQKSPTPTFRFPSSTPFDYRYDDWSQGVIVIGPEPPRRSTLGNQAYAGEPGEAGFQSRCISPVRRLSLEDNEIDLNEWEWGKSSHIQPELAARRLSMDDSGTHPISDALSTGSSRSIQSNISSLYPNEGLAKRRIGVNDRAGLGMAHGKFATPTIPAIKGAAPRMRSSLPPSRDHVPIVSAPNQCRASHEPTASKRSEAHKARKSSKFRPLSEQYQKSSPNYRPPPPPPVLEPVCFPQAATQSIPPSDGYSQTIQMGRTSLDMGPSLQVGTQPRMSMKTSTGIIGSKLHVEGGLTEVPYEDIGSHCAAHSFSSGQDTSPSITSSSPTDHPGTFVALQRGITLPARTRLRPKRRTAPTPLTQASNPHEPPYSLRVAPLTPRSAFTKPQGGPLPNGEQGISIYDFLSSSPQSTSTSNSMAPPVNTYIIHPSERAKIGLAACERARTRSFGHKPNIESTNGDWTAWHDSRISPPPPNGYPTSLRPPPRPMSHSPTKLSHQHSAEFSPSLAPQQVPKLSHNDPRQYDTDSVRFVMSTMRDRAESESSESATIITPKSSGGRVFHPLLMQNEEHDSIEREQGVEKSMVLPAGHPFSAQNGSPTKKSKVRNDPFRLRENERETEEVEAVVGMKRRGSKRDKWSQLFGKR